MAGMQLLLFNSSLDIRVDVCKFHALLSTDIFLPGVLLNFDKNINIWNQASQQ